MKHWKLGLALAGLFAVPFAWAGQVVNPVNAPATIGSGDIYIASGTNPQQAADSGKAVPSGAIVGTTDTQTLTNKSIAASEINSGVLGNAQIPLPTTSALGGIEAIACPSHQWIDAVPTTAVQPTCAQPAAADLSNGISGSGGNVMLSAHPALSGTAPAASGSTSPTVVGNDEAGRVTVGTSPTAAVTLTFNASFANAPVCFAVDETTTAKNPLNVTAVSTAAVTFTAAATLVAGDKVAFKCTAFQ